MNILKKFFTLLTILSFLNICLPSLTLAEEVYRISSADRTIHEPELISTKPAKVQKTKKKKVPTWVWVVGLALAGGAIAASGGGSGGGDNGSEGEKTGAVTVDW